MNQIGDAKQGAYNGACDISKGIPHEPDRSKIGPQLIQGDRLWFFNSYGFQ